MEYPGDKHLWAFRCMWHKIVSCLAGDITKIMLRKQLRKKLDWSKIMQPDLQHYDREEYKKDS